MSIKSSHPSRRQAAKYTLLFSYSIVGFSIINGIVLVPLYLNFFDLATYGAWLASGNIVGLLGIFSGGVNLVINQRLATAFGQEDYHLFAQTSGSGFLINTVAALLIGSFSLILAPWVPQWVNSPQEQFAALSAGFVMAGLGSAFTLVLIMMQGIANAWQRTFFAGFANFIGLVVGVVATIIGLFLGLGVSAIGLGVMLRGLFGLLLLTGYVVYMWLQLHLPRPTTPWSVSQNLAITTFPVAVSRIGSVILGNSQATIVAILMEPTSAAVITLTGRVYGVCQSLLAPFGSSVMAGVAHFGSSRSKEDTYAILKEIISLFSATAALVLGVAFALNESFINLWVGPESWGGPILSFWLCMVVLFKTRLTLINYLLVGLGEINRTAWSSLLELFIQLPLMLLFIQLFGLVGLPMAEITAILLISAWYYPKLLTSRLSLNRKNALSISLEGTWPIGASFVVGIIWQILAPLPEAWLGFVVALAINLTIVSFLIYLLSPMSRIMVRRGIHRGQHWRNHLMKKRLVK